MGALPFSGLLVGLLLLDIVMLMPSLESLCLNSLTSSPPGMFVRGITQLTATCQCARGLAPCSSEFACNGQVNSTTDSV